MLRSSTANDVAYIHDTSRRPYPATVKYCQSVTVPPISVWSQWDIHNGLGLAGPLEIKARLGRMY